MLQDSSLRLKTQYVRADFITLWVTGLTALSRDPKTGLLQQPEPGPVGFGVAQNGNDIPATVSYNSFDGVYVGQFQTTPAIWAGESPQFVGLDQINVNFPACAGKTKATVEKRYDAFMNFVSMVARTNVRIYLPFVVSPGEPDCQPQWSATTTTLTSSSNPSTSGQAVTLTASVSPSASTGTVTFQDGTTTLGTSAMNGGRATYSTLSLTPGTHSITARYGGDRDYTGSTSATLIQTVNPVIKTNTTTILRATPIPGGVALMSTVSPATASGAVTFLDNGGLLGTATLKIVPICTSGDGGGQCVEVTASLLPGTHSITASYTGNTSHNASTSTGLILLGTATTITSSSNPVIGIHHMNTTGQGDQAGA